MQKGFSLLEILVSIAIVALMLGLALPKVKNYIISKKIEEDTHAIYLTVKRAQLRAKLTKRTHCIELQDPYTLIVKNSTCSGSGDIIDNLTLRVPFNATKNLTVNYMGIFTQQGSIYYNSTSGDIIDCVKASNIRVCEGYWDGSSCVCKY